VRTPHTGDDSKQHSEDKAHRAMTSDNRRHVAELIALIFYVIVDAFGPLSHFWAIFPGAVVISVLVSAELPIKWGIAASASIFAIAALVYFVSPPILPEETETHGWLLPANAPTPENGCDQMPRPTGALLFVAGTNGALPESPDKSTILNIGNSTQLSVERDESRLAFDADIYNNTGNLSVRIVRNEFHLVSGEYSYQERSGDRSTITVYNKQGGEMLYVYYANATTVLIRGLFTSPDGTRIRSCALGRSARGLFRPCA
jgi:hypothetical protein